MSPNPHRSKSFVFVNDLPSNDSNSSHRHLRRPHRRRFTVAAQFSLLLVQRDKLGVHGHQIALTGHFIGRQRQERNPLQYFRFQRKRFVLFEDVGGDRVQRPVDERLVVFQSLNRPIQINYNCPTRKCNCYYSIQSFTE